MTMQHAVRKFGDVTILDISGRISLGEALAFGAGSAPILHEVVREQVVGGHRKILLNLANVTYIDSSGLGEIVSCMTAAKNRGGQLRICNVKARVDDLLRITRLNTVLNFDTDEATALKAFANENPKSASAA
jgi:anti-sigma B factor antagonist